MGSNVSSIDKPRGRRILCLDGGGMRGVASIEILNQIEKKADKPIHELFDLICGTSTGGILALGLGLQLVQTTEALTFYKTLGCQIFPRRALFTFLLKSFAPECPILGTYFDGYDIGSSLYDQSVLRSVATREFGEYGEKKLQEFSTVHPKVFAVSSVSWNHGFVPFLFRTYQSRHFEGYDKDFVSASNDFDSPQGYVSSQNSNLLNFTVIDAILATSAAPLYFGPYSYQSFDYDNLPGDYTKTYALFNDGGVVANNPTELAIFEAKRLWPGEPIECIVSIGTGSTNEKDKRESDNKENKLKLYRKWYTKASLPYFPISILQLVTNSQAIHWRVRNWLSIAREAKHGPLANTHYFRFNPKNFPREFGLADSSDQTIQALQECAKTYMKAPGPSFRLEQLVRVLNGEKLAYQDIQPEWIKLSESDSSTFQKPVTIAETNRK